MVPVQLLDGKTNRNIFCMNILSSRIKIALEQSIIPETKKSFSLYPSSASITLSQKTNGKNIVGSCLRQQYYRITGEPATHSMAGDIKVSTMLGDYITKMVEDLLDNHGFICNLQRIASEHSFYIPEINVSGRCDFIGYDNINKEVIGIEVKSVGEYKAGKCMEKPAEEHVLQSLIYLNHYKKTNPKLNIKKWYILYISRTENYAIKAKKHGSDLAMIWDFYITIDDKDQAAIIHSSNGTEKWADFNIKNIYSRFDELSKYLASSTVPPKDYKLYYSEEDLASMFKKGELTRKADIEKMEKWLKKGAPKDKLKIELGDIECSFCAYKGVCWPGLQKEDPKPEIDISKLITKDNIIKDDKISQNWV